SLESCRGLNDVDREGNKTCTYETTGGTMYNQHYYRCFVCFPSDSMGVCSVCARDCGLKGHRFVHYYGPFFCDRGRNADLANREMNRQDDGDMKRDGKKCVIL